MSRLTAAQRRALPSSAFADPKDRKYPVTDKGHAEAAVARAKEFGSSAQQSAVAKKAKKYGVGPEARAKRAGAVKHAQKTMRDSRGDTYKPGDKVDSAGDRLGKSRDSRGDRL